MNFDPRFAGAVFSLLFKLRADKRRYSHTDPITRISTLAGHYCKHLNLFSKYIQSCKPQTYKALSHFVFPNVNTFLPLRKHGLSPNFII